MRAANTAIPEKAQNVTTNPAAPATAPAMGVPRTCPTAMSRKAAPIPADGRSWKTDGPDEDDPREHDVARAEERPAEVCREERTRSGGQQPDRRGHAKERGAE